METRKPQKPERELVVAAARSAGVKRGQMGLTLLVFPYVAVLHFCLTQLRWIASAPNFKRLMGRVLFSFSLW